MKICLHCGTQTKDEDDYCPQCGRPVYKEQIVQAPIPEPNQSNPMKDVIGS
jgi:uncharacterized membrane protein YvbJ